MSSAHEIVRQAVEEIALQVPNIKFYQPEVTFDAMVNRMIHTAVSQRHKFAALAVVTKDLKPLTVIVYTKSDVKQACYDEWRFVQKGKKVVAQK
jgi:hypothetical protein